MARMVGRRRPNDLLKSFVFWCSFLGALARPTSAAAREDGSFALSWSDVVLLFVATLAAFLWVLSAIE